MGPAWVESGFGLPEPSPARPAFSQTRIDTDPFAHYKSLGTSNLFSAQTQTTTPASITQENVYSHHCSHDSPTIAHPPPLLHILSALKSLLFDATAPTPASGLRGLALLWRDLPTLLQQPSCLLHAQAEKVWCHLCSHFFECLMLVLTISDALCCRYGSIFKTHILGCHCVMVSSPEAAKFVLVSNAHLFKPTFPASKERMLGTQAIFFQHGEYHARLRKVVQRAFLPDAIRGLVSDIEEIAVDALALKAWEGRKINTFQEMKTVSSNLYLIGIVN